MTVSTKVDDRTGQPVVNQANKIPKPHKKEPKIERDNPLCSDIPEWLQEFREILVDDEIPLQGGSHASSSHEASLEPTFQRREDLGSKCAELKKGPPQYCCSQVWMRIGGQIPWNAIPICETFKIYYLMGKNHTKGVLENLLQDLLFHLVHWLSITL